MKNIFKKTGACLLSALTVLSIAACGGGESGSSSSSSPVKVDGEVEIWSKASTVNVRRDDEYSESFKEEAKYSILAGRGEFEASQIIITTPAGLVVEYDIEVSDLTCGEHTIDKSYIDVYNEKYISVISSSAANSTGTGYYADALLPFEKAVEYGENVAGDKEAMRNQGIYIETFVPRDTPAGVYTGAFELTVDGKKTNIPASVTVCDFDVSQVSHFEQDWIVNLKGFGELDTTAAMNRKYFEEVAAFRAGTHSMSMGAQNADEWMETVRKYTNPNLRDEEGNPLIGEKECYLAGINLPASYDATYGINRKQFDNYLSRLVYWSVKDNFNYLAKVGTYPGFIDEPHYNNTWPKVKQACEGWNTYKNLWASEIVEAENVATINEKLAADQSAWEIAQEDFDALSDEFKAQLAKSMSLVNFYVTTTPNKNLDNTATTQFCAPIYSFTSQQERYEYAYWTDVETGGNWAYGAGNSTFGNRLDSEPVEQRVMSYRMYETGIRGFLVWEVAQYQQIIWNPDARANQYSPCDPYTQGQRISNGAGDGYILYPGKPYGIFGPVGSIRAHQYRDSSEEYEYLYLLEQLYAEKGYSPKEVLTQMFSFLYSEEAVTTDTEIFALQRRQLINLILLAQKGVFVTDFTQEMAKAEMNVVSTGDENIVSVGGETVTATKNAKVALDMTTEAGALSFATDGGESFTAYLGGKATLLLSADASKITMAGGVATADTVEGQTSVRLDFAPDETVPEAKRNYQATFAAQKSDITRETKYLLSTFYNPTDKAVLVQLWFMGTDNRTTYVDDVVVYPGQYATMITARLDTVSWGTIRSLEGIRFKVSSLEGETEYTVHFMGMYTLN